MFTRFRTEFNLKRMVLLPNSKKALKSISSSKFTKGCLLMLHELLIKLLKKRKLTLQSKKRIRLQLWNACSTKGHNPKRWRVGKTAVGKKIEMGTWRLRKLEPAAFRCALASRIDTAAASACSHLLLLQKSIKIHQFPYLSRDSKTRSVRKP